MRLPFAPPPRIVVFTGPGLSRAAGFAPFDPEAMPWDVALDDVLTRAGFERDPELVYDFYNRRRRELQAVRPSAAHEALTALDAARPGEVLVVTRNIDALHERAGHRAVVHTHGELMKARCAICTNISDWLDDMSAAARCPVCGNEGHLQPHIVWVGEPPLGLDAAYPALAGCAVYAAIGNGAAGEPGRGFLAAARQAGARTLEFAADPTPLSREFDERHHGPVVETVPAWVKRQIGGDG
jgi:NAD-dependent protein deacetylase/lipoamidase